MELTWRHKSAHLSTFRQQHLRQPAAPSTHSPTLTLSLVHLSLHSLTLKQREGGREGEEGKIGGYPSCRAPWIASKGRAPQGMGDRRGRSPLFLTTLELGGEEQARRSPSHQEQDPVFPSYRGAQHHSFATLGKLKLELNAHVHTTHDHEPINLHQWPRTCLHTIM